jgi:hypothetical protein
MRPFLLSALFCLTIFLVSCIKQTTEDPDATVVCTSISSIKATATPTTITIGESSTIAVTNVVDVIYSWTEPFNNSVYARTLDVSNAGLKDRGWYYVNAYNPNCTATKSDSVYLNVKLKQGTPACTIPNNTCNNSLVSSETYSSITRGIDASYGVLSLSASTAGGDIRFLFHPHWKFVEPEDGIYETINSPTFDPVNPEYNKVFFTITKSSIYWASWADQTVYVSHLNGKLQVRFCNLNLNGSLGGPVYTNKSSANLIQN